MITLTPASKIMDPKSKMPFTGIIPSHDWATTREYIAYHDGIPVGENFASAAEALSVLNGIIQLENHLRLQFDR